MANPPADPDQVARTILLRRLEAAPRTRAQLATTLRQREVPENVAERVLTRFEEVGLIDDRAFALSWVESRQRVRHLAPRALQMELRQRGVAADLIDAALATLDPSDERSAAREVARRKARSVAGLPRPTQVRRLSGALARKGYGPGLSAHVVREVLDEVRAAADDDDVADDLGA